MSDLTEKSLDNVIRDEWLSFLEKVPRAEAKCHADAMAFKVACEAVASHATAQLQSSLQKCQGEVDHYKREWKDRTEQLETWIKDHHNLEREAAQLRALLAEAREALEEVERYLAADMSPVSPSFFAWKGRYVSNTVICAISKISAAIGDNNGA